MLDEQEEVKEATNLTNLPTVKGHVVFEHVDFGYKEAALLIQDMNLDVKPGQIVAIVGPTGAGKNDTHQFAHAFFL
ncbi:hypothetical protein GCM10020331_069910 [Ectobacillus funiculus]